MQGGVSVWTQRLPHPALRAAPPCARRRLVREHSGRSIRDRGDGGRRARVRGTRAPGRRRRAATPRGDLDHSVDSEDKASDGGGTDGGGTEGTTKLELSRAPW